MSQKTAYLERGDAYAAKAGYSFGRYSSVFRRFFGCDDVLKFSLKEVDVRKVRLWTHLMKTLADKEND